MGHGFLMPAAFAIGALQDAFLQSTRNRIVAAHVTGIGLPPASDIGNILSLAMRLFGAFRIILPYPL
jgi:hypothetical protein